MVIKIFSVYDSKAEAYLPPFFMPSRGVALRAFAEASNSADHKFSRYAADFTLFELGEFCDSTCKFKLHAALINLGSALEFRKDFSSDVRDVHESLII